MLQSTSESLGGRWLLGLSLLALISVGKPGLAGDKPGGVTTVVFAASKCAKFSTPLDLETGAVEAMRDASRQHFHAMIFPPSAASLAKAFVQFARDPKRSKQRDYAGHPDDFLLAKGERFFWLIEVSWSPADHTSLELWSDLYDPIILQYYEPHSSQCGDSRSREDRLCRAGATCADCDEEEGLRIFGLPPAKGKRQIIPLSGVRDLRPLFAGFIRSHGFEPVDLLGIRGARFERADAARPVFKLRGESVERRWNKAGAITLPKMLVAHGGSRPRQNDASEALAAVRELPIYREGKTSTHVYLEIRLTFGYFDWEAAGPPDKAKAGPEEIPRLVVLERSKLEAGGALRAGWISIQRSITPAEGRR